MEESDILRRVQFFSFPNCRASLCLEDTHRSLLVAENYECGSVMVRAAISSNSLSPIAALHGRVNSKVYLNILGEDNAPIHTAHMIKN